MKEEHVAIVMEGAEAVRQFREMGGKQPLDLSNADLRGKDLSDIEFGRKAEVAHSSPDGNFQWKAFVAKARRLLPWLSPEEDKIQLRDVDLLGADMTGADLSKADLSGLDLRDVKLHGATLIGTQFRGANLSELDLSGQRDASPSRLDSNRYRAIDRTGLRRTKSRLPSHSTKVCRTSRHCSRPDREIAFLTLDLAQRLAADVQRADRAGVTFPRRAVSQQCGACYPRF